MDGIFWKNIQQDMDVESKGDGEFKDDSSFWFEHVGGWWCHLLSKRILGWEAIFRENHMPGFGHWSLKCLQVYQVKTSSRQLDILI